MKEIKSSDYSIFIGKNTVTKLNISKYSKIAILVDENTKRYCLNYLPKLNNSITIEISSGEKNKNITTCEFIWGILNENNFDKKSLLINLGGGVIGDIGGFCASTYLRGIDFIQVPTTLVGMVDASIGGKSGINFEKLKNHIGVFNNPKLVLIHPKFLDTLPENQLKFGFSEIIKHALIADINLWRFIKSNSLTSFCWEDIIYRSVKIKNQIIIHDPLDEGERKKLNFGHTYGHAIESYYLAKDLPIMHGEAVLMGMLMEVELSLITKKVKKDIQNYILSNFNLPYQPSKNELMEYLIKDKKNISEKINFSLLKSIGECTFNNLLTKDEL